MSVMAKKLFGIAKPDGSLATLEDWGMGDDWASQVIACSDYDQVKKLLADRANLPDQREEEGYRIIELVDNLSLIERTSAEEFIYKHREWIDQIAEANDDFGSCFGVSLCKRAVRTNKDVLMGSTEDVDVVQLHFEHGVVEVYRDNFKPLSKRRVTRFDEIEFQKHVQEECEPDSTADPSFVSTANSDGIPILLNGIHANAVLRHAGSVVCGELNKHLRGFGFQIRTLGPPVVVTNEEDEYLFSQPTLLAALRLIYKN